MNQKRYMTLGIVGFFLLIAIIMFSNATFLTIDSGERGVLFRTFGDGLDHETFGRDYMNRLVRPEVRSAVRQVIGKFTPEELYSTKRDEVQTLITAELAKVLATNFIDLRAILIRDIELPTKVRTAIEEKLEAEQASLKYEFILTREKQEAERRLIEAQAKADANRILAASLSANILQDKGIEATLELAKSPNSKVVVVGDSGNGGLPLILGGGN